MTWTETIPAVLAAIGVLFVPGIIIGLAFRLRPHLLVALAPALSVASVFVAAVGTGLLNMRLNLLGPLVVAVVSAAAIWAIMELFDRQGLNRYAVGKQAEPISARESATILGQYLVGIVILVAALLPSYLRAIGDPSNVMQRWDNAFHLNAVRWIGETGQGSPLEIGWMVNAGFYPLSWHDVTALVWRASGVPLTGTVHAVFLVLIFLVWPLGLSAVVESAFRTNAFVRIAFGPLTLMFMSYPHMVLEGGGLYSNAFGMGLAPALLAVMFQILQLGERVQIPFASAVLLAIVILAGVGSAHPNAAMAVAALIVPALLWTIWRSWHRPTTPSDGGSTMAVRYFHPKAWTIFAIVAVLGLAAAWVVLAPGLDVAPWAQFQTIPQAIGEVMVGTSMTKQPVWPGSLLFMAGVLALLTRRKDLRWMAAVYAVAAGLYIVTTAFGVSVLRSLITGVFFNDARRTGSALALMLSPIAAVALREIWDSLKGPVGRFLGSHKIVIPMLPVLVGLVTSALGGYLLLSSKGLDKQLHGDLHDAYVYAWNAEMLSADEKIMLDRLPGLTPEDAVIATNPYSGASLAYALAGRHVVQYYMYDLPEEDNLTINQSLREATTNPDVCPAVERLGVTHALVFEPHLMANAEDDYPGLHITRATPGFSLVKQIGRVQLYELTACGRG